MRARYLYDGAPPLHLTREAAGGVLTTPLCVSVAMNAPTLYDRFIVPEGKRKVAFEADTKVASAGTFTVQREDHTLGNLIRMCVRPALKAHTARVHLVSP
jgi:hypothetical protein